MEEKIDLLGAANLMRGLCRKQTNTMQYNDVMSSSQTADEEAISEFTQAAGRRGR